MAGTDGFGITLLGSVTTVNASIVDVEIPGITRGEIDVTTHSSSNGWMEKLPQGVQGIPDITFTVLYIKTQDTAYRTGSLANAETWTVTAPDTSTWAASGFIKEISYPAVPVDDVIRCSVTIGFTGAATFTPAA